jgi:hypothetical protein
MSQPTRSDVHVNRPLTNISIAYIQEAGDFIADKVFPMVPVAKQADRYFKYDKKQWFRSNAKKRAPSTESAGGGFSLDNTPTYFAHVQAIHMDVSDQIRANADEPINLDRDATQFVTQQLLLRREKDFVSNYFKTGVWTGSSTGTDIVAGTKWDASGSDPVNDVDTQRDAMKEKTGMKANIMVVTPAVHRALKNNASILDRIKHTQRGVVTAELLASLFEVEKYLVASATEDDAGEGATESMDYVFGDEGVMLVYAPAQPSILKPSAGYVFAWTGLFGASAMGNRIKRFRMEHLESDRIEGEMAYDMKLVAADCGVFFSDVLT